MGVVAAQHNTHTVRKEDRDQGRHLKIGAGGWAGGWVGALRVQQEVAAPGEQHVQRGRDFGGRGLRNQPTNQ
jgi:hypothetical protein